MDEKQLEALRAELDEAKASIEALSNKNRELIGVNKKLKQQSQEIDPETYHKMSEELDTLKDAYSKLEKSYKGETEKLSKSLSEKESFLQKMIVDDGLTNALSKAGVRPEFLDGAKALLRSQAQIKSNEGRYEAVISDKPLNDFITEWATKDGKHYVQAPLSSGGGAVGGGGGHTTTKGDFGGDKIDRLNAIKSKFNLGE